MRILIPVFDPTKQFIEFVQTDLVPYLILADLQPLLGNFRYHYALYIFTLITNTLLKRSLPVPRNQKLEPTFAFGVHWIIFQYQINYRVYNNAKSVPRTHSYDLALFDFVDSTFLHIVKGIRSCRTEKCHLFMQPKQDITKSSLSVRILFLECHTGFVDSLTTGFVDNRICCSMS